ncbi:MAG: hypothetical protein GX796_11955 [Clostridiaceae bacterium]|nr:hypothetical protein [Clostridiaceae bacterium]
MGLKFGKMIKTKSIKVKSNTADKARKIRTSLFLAFCVPIILIIALGAGAYYITSEAMVNRYEESTSSTMNSMTLYFNSICDNVKAKMAELIIDENVNSYYNKYGKEVNLESTSYYNAVRDNFIALKGSLKYISDYYVFAQIGETITSHSKTLPKSLYEDYQSQDEAKDLTTGNARNKWFGFHPYLDSIVENTTDIYGFSYIVKLQKNNGFIVLDINRAYLEDALNTMTLGEGSIKALVTKDGREIAIKENKENDDNINSDRIETKENIFIGKDFFEESVNASTSGISNENYNGEEYLYSYSPIGSTGIMLCTLIPKNIIMKEVNQVRDLTIVIILVAFIIVLIIGLKISNGISKDLLRTCRSLDLVSDGDLTTDFYTNRRDEFKLLNLSMNKMLENIRKLIGEMKQFGSRVSESASGVSKTSEYVFEKMNVVSTSVDEVLAGIVSQASDTEDVAGKMSEFSDKLNVIYENSEQMNNTADETIRTISSGQIIVDELNNKTQNTVDITKDLIQEIGEVQKKTDNIESIVKYISGIAENTNLLSLNASIEAARAGDAGRGFAVVADEIRKLADQSIEYNNQIKKIVDDIRNKTAIAVQSAEKAGVYMSVQTSSLNDTNDVFDSINNHVSSLVNGLRLGQNSMTKMINDKERILEAICSISAISQESSAASQEVNSIVGQQLVSISSLEKEAEKLKEDVSKLEDSMSRFTIL